MREGVLRELFIRRYGEGGGVIARGRIEKVVYWKVWGGRGVIVRGRIARGRIERVVYSKVWGGRGSYCERAY